MQPASARFSDSVATFFRRVGSALARHPFIALASVVPLALAALVAYVLVIIPLTPSIDNIKKSKAEQPTVILSADGKELAVFKRANREWVKLADVSPNVLAALLATEDHRFFEHHGLDLRRTLSAAVRSLRGDLQGGSTISQQLARNLYPDEIGRAATVTRKVKEAITAIKIESVYSKNEILEMYLNTVPFLYNAYGIEMAARTYFDKSADELDVLQSATLIGMLKGTSYYNPVLNPERAMQRRNTVLAQMVKHSKLKPAEFDTLKMKPLALEFERQEEDIGTAPHVSQQLRRWLISWADKHGYNIYADGLVVRTTIDSRLQQMAVEALQRQADKLQKNADAGWGKRMGAPANKQLVADFVRETAEYKAARATGLDDAEAVKKIQADTEFMQKLWSSKTQLQAAFMAQDPTNGHILAWVGSRDFKQDQFDHVQQARRQPGSTFKPFVYGAAFDQGISPSEMLIDQAVEIRIDAKTVWKPGDAHGSTGLPTSLRDGLVFSKNTITAQLMQRVGPARVAQVAYAMGVRHSKLDQVPSLALGTSPVTLKEMVSSYSTIVNTGAYIEPVLVTRIENRAHEVLEQFRSRAPEQGLSAPAAQTLLDVMRGVIEKGTGAGIRSVFGLQGDLAGKTGTTQDNTDGWFILMHPQLVSGAWVGFNDNRITMGDAWGQGARNALYIVGDFFQQTAKARVVDMKAQFAAPRDSGLQDPSMLGKLNDLLGGNFAAPSPDGQGQPTVVAEPQPGTILMSPDPVATASPAPSRPAFVEPRVIAAPTPGFDPALQQRSSDSQWRTERQPTIEYSTEERRPPPASELGAGGAQPQGELRPMRPGEGGVRILREVSPVEAQTRP